MTEVYRRQLIQLAKEILEYRQTTDYKDIIFLSKLDYLLGYIMALEEKEEK